MALQWKSGGGADLPNGGTTGQALVKKSDANQDVEWGNVAGSSIQVDTMPEASRTELGHIYQYVGATNQDYKNGYFYECISDGQDPATYSWVEKNVQYTPSGILPAGGTTAQALVKASDADDDTKWSDVPTSDWLTNKTLAPTGWGVATSGTLNFTNVPTGDTTQTVDVSEFGFTSPDDYSVSTIISSPGSAFNTQTSKITNKTATSFDFVNKNTLDQRANVDWDYTITAKGYGGTHFLDNTGIPEGGKLLQILEKSSESTDGVVRWANDTGKMLVSPTYEWGFVENEVPLKAVRAGYGGGVGDDYIRFFFNKGGVLQNKSNIMYINENFDIMTGGQ